MDISGSNHWLPAYGFQQPIQLQQALLHHQEDASDGGSVQQQFLFLETILEETSDDLRSESDRSGHAGWPDSDSDAESVIHVRHNADDWSGSERDLAVPKKRQRRTADDDGDMDTASLSSRSSSLLQFECLEKHCEDVFRVCDPFPPPSPSVHSSFSFDSLESTRWRFSSTSPDSLEDLPEENSSSDEDSDDTLQHSSLSSRSSRCGSFRLRSFRSFDSLNLLQPPQQLNTLAELSQSLNSNSFLQQPAHQVNAMAELSQSLNSNSFLGQQPSQQTLVSATTADLSTSVKPEETKSEGKTQRSAENLSEDSGFGDQCSKPAGTTTVDTIVEDYYSDSSGDAGGSETSEQEMHEERVLKLDSGLWGTKFNSRRLSERADMAASTPNLTQVPPLKMEDTLLVASKSLKGVHFSPVVSEVSWRDSYSSSSDSDHEEQELEMALEALERGQDVAGPPKKDLIQHNVTMVQRIEEETSPQHGMDKKHKNKLGGFFQRFSFRKLTGKQKKQEAAASTPEKTREAAAEYEDVTIVPLHAPVKTKPPLPPLPPRPTSPRKRAAAPRIDPPPPGLLETDLDTHVSTVRHAASSLMDMSVAMLLKPPPGGSSNRPLTPADSRAKSMEFLLDKQNQAAVQPPENELQKVGVGERVMSEHQLRVQRSLQKLNVPDWYKNSSVARGPEGFLLKRGSDGGTREHGWPGLSSKTTSLSSLGSTQSAAARSPTSHLLSPSPTPHVFTRWSTSRLNSGGTSASTSPCGSTRSSFNYRQPYLGWRSQERLSRPRTPAERLAAGLLPQQQQQQLPSPQGPPPLTPQQDLQQLLQQESELESLRREDEEHMAQVPNLSEVRTSIKEVTSAIVHYVSGVQDGSREALTGDSGWDSLMPPHRGSPRGSSGRLCWLESSFVGSRPLDSPETPLNLTSDDVTKTLETLQQQQQQKQQTQADVKRNSDLYLDLSLSSHHHVNGPEEEEDHKPSPGSTTLEDVLDSLLGLPPTSRSPSPGPGSASPGHCRPRSHQRRSCGDLRTDLAGSASDGTTGAAPYYVSDTLRRRSEGSAKQTSNTGQVARGGRRVSFDTSSSGGQQPPHHAQADEPESMVKCRYSKCGRTASVTEARRTYKTCHNCSHVYCSRECRRAHWERHRKTCLHSRVGALCRQVLATVREDPPTLRHLSLLARRGYLAQGRGAVKSFFSSPELAERFVAKGFAELGEPAFVRWADLLPDEMGADLYSELLRLCKSYNPDSRFVLYVAVCVVSEVPTSGAVKWERQLVSRCAKLRLCRTLTTSTPPQVPSTPQRRGASPCNITRDSENPETLILTSLPGCQGQMPAHRAREISFTNIQRHLRQRGVSLRRHFPDVYKRLCAYVEGSVERFTPVTVYPRDAVTGKSFMCIIMPDAEPEKLELVPWDSSRVQTIDISLEHEPT